MEIIKTQLRQAARALGNALVRTVPTAAVTSWLVAYALEWSYADMLRLAGDLQPIRPLLELVAGA